MKKGFTLIELLAVIVILAIIALIATPIILNIIEDTKEESNQRSMELYAKAVENAIASYQLINPTAPTNFSQLVDGYIKYDGDVECNMNKSELYEDGSFYLSDCSVNGSDKKYSYGEERTYSFANDSWETIISNVKKGYGYKYTVGEEKEIELDGYINEEKDENGNNIGTYTVRLANTPSETDEEEKKCGTEEFSETACGFVIEFVDIIVTYKMNETNTLAGGWRDSKMRRFVTPLKDENQELIKDSGIIYNSLPEKLRNNIIETKVISGQGRANEETNYETIDKLYLLSEKEVWGDNLGGDGSSNRTRQLDCYINQNVPSIDYLKYKKNFNGSLKAWWLRSAVSKNGTGHFYTVNSGGSWDFDVAISANGIAPAFRLG